VLAEDLHLQTAARLGAVVEAPELEGVRRQVVELGVGDLRALALAIVRVLGVEQVRAAGQGPVS